MRASNTLRVANNSTEVIGGDRDITIKGNAKEQISQDKYEKIKGHLNIRAKEEINIISESQLDLNAKANMLFTSNQSISMDMKEYFIAQAKNAIMQVLESLEIKAHTLHLDAQDELELKIGEAKISITKDKLITLNANGNELILDDSGINIKTKNISISKGD